MNTVADPFADEPQVRAPPCEKKATKSRVDGLSVGDVRYVFSQLRSSETIEPDQLLYCGLRASEFAVKYLKLEKHSEKGR